jgi:Uma2 family endonuclease
MTMVEFHAEAFPMSHTARLVTAGEFEKLPVADHRYELVDGRVVRMTPVGFRHGRVVMAFGLLLGAHVKGRKLGVVCTEVGFQLTSNPDTVRAPDLAFVEQQRIPSTDPKGFWPGAPDMAVEVLSPDDRRSDIDRKIEEYLARGVRLAVVLDPDKNSATVYRRLTPPIVLRDEQTIDLDDVVPGFRCTVREVFE